MKVYKHKMYHRSLNKEKVNKGSTGVLLQLLTDIKNDKLCIVIVQLNT